MNKKPRSIVWQPWLDEDYTLNKPDDKEDDDKYQDSFMRPQFFVPEMIRTPIGMFSPRDPLLPSKLFSCWVANTNFDIGTKEYNILMTTPGIEIIRIMSRYRFFLGVGKLFTFRDVRRQLNRDLCGALSKEDEQDEKLFKEMEKVKKWAVFLPNSGEPQRLIGLEGEDPEFDETLKTFLHRRDGRTITSGMAEYNSKNYWAE
ncbi:MAG: hypothetical protein ACHQ1D_00530 [Nitrososphaerales archaeon]